MTADICDISLPLQWWYQHDNDPKHIFKDFKEKLMKNRIELLELPAAKEYHLI